jgi:hypothetical protein
MAEAEPAAAPPRRPLIRHAAEIALEGAALALLVAITAAVVAVRSREAVAEQFAEDWLRQHGVDGDVEVARIDASGFSGRVRLGPPDDPDLTADRVDVDYALAPPWAGPFSVTPRSIRLIGPRVKASFDGKRLHFGSLDPLIRDLLSRPKTNAPAPDIRIDDGAMRLSTPYGLVKVDDTQANFSQGRLERLEAHLLDADLHSGRARAVIDGGLVSLTGDGLSLQGSTELNFTALSAATTRLDRGAARLAIDDLRYDLSEGTVGVSAKARLQMRASSLTAAGVAAAAPQLSAEIPYLQATLGATTNGRFDITARMTAQALSGPERARLVSIEGAAKDARFSTASGPRVWSPVHLRASVQTVPVTVGGETLTLNQARADLTGRFDSGAAAVLSGRTALSAQGRMTKAAALRLAENVPVLGQEAKYRDALARGLERFTLSAPAIDLALGRSLAVSPHRRITVDAASGASAGLTPSSLTLGSKTSGGFELKLGDGGLPPITLEASRIEWREEGLSLHAALTSTLDFGPAKDADVALSGTVDYGKAGFSLTADRCATLSAAYLDLGENRVEKPAVQACPISAAPLIVARSGGWRLQGALREGRAEVPFLQARTEHAAGRFAVYGQQAGVGAQIDLTSAPVIDTSDPRRFEPLIAKGPLRLDHDRWDGALEIAAAQQRTLGSVRVVHDQLSGTGFAEIDASPLAFARGGLQPADITPVAAIVADAQGAAAFTARLDWSKDQPAHGTGRLLVSSLDFTSPLGPVSGLSADVTLTSLSPLVTAQDQVVTARSVEAFAPITNVRAVFDLTQDRLNLGSAEAKVARGVARLEPMTIPFAEDQTVTGAIDLDDINLNDLVALTSYADRIKTDLVLDGRLPFQADAKSFRLSDGHLVTVKPGRIAIARQVLSGVESGQAVAQVQGAPNAPAVAQAPATNAVQDLVYDVLENLAVDSLEATVESQPGGRLGALFSIKGRFDPPVAPDTTLPLADLISRKPLDKIPLPKGTPVNLTLDTSLNFDELIKGVQSSIETFKSLHQASRSGPVQR